MRGEAERTVPEPVRGATRTAVEPHDRLRQVRPTPTGRPPGRDVPSRSEGGTSRERSSPVATPVKGRILAVRGPVLDVRFPAELPARELPALHETLRVTNRDRALILEVQQQLEQNTVRAVALGPTEGLVRGLEVEPTGRCVHVPVGPAVLGRVFNVLGEPLDGRPLPHPVDRWPIHRPVQSQVVARPSETFLETGIKVIDLLAPLARGCTAGIIGGGGVGKTILLQELMRVMSRHRDAVVVFAGVGERSREGLDLWLEMQESGALDNSVLVLGQMNEPPGTRFRAPLTALTMAEYFRDREEKEVILLIDSISRYLQAGGEVSALLGRLPAEMGYQPTLASDLALVEARAAAPAWVGMTTAQAIYVPADDPTDPAVAQAFTHLDAAIVLSRERAARGLYPAVDPVASSSQLLHPGRLSERHCEVAQRVRQTIDRYRQLEDVIFMLGVQELREEDQQAAHRARRLERFLTQPLFAAESFTGQPGRHVCLEDTLASCEAILGGEFDAVDEHRLYMIGSAGGVAR